MKREDGRQDAQDRDRRDEDVPLAIIADWLEEHGHAGPAAAVRCLAFLEELGGWQLSTALTPADQFLTLGGHADMGLAVVRAFERLLRFKPGHPSNPSSAARRQTVAATGTLHVGVARIPIRNIAITSSDNPIELGGTWPDRFSMVRGDFQVEVHHLGRCVATFYHSFSQESLDRAEAMARRFAASEILIRETELSRRVREEGPGG